MNCGRRLVGRSWLVVQFGAVAAFAGSVLAQTPDVVADTALRDGVAAYRAGRFEAAYASFAAALAAAPESASRELRWNTALAALRVLRSSDAEAALLPLRDQGDAAAQAEVEFVLAMVAHQRAERAALAAQLPDAEPTAWTIALRAMQQAVDGFARADALRGQWPAAARNAERATRRLQELQRARDAAKPPAAQQEAAPPPPPPQPKGSGEEQTADAPQPVVQPMDAAEVAQLVQRLQQKDKEKRAVRQQTPPPSGGAAERDW